MREPVTTGHLTDTPASGIFLAQRLELGYEYISVRGDRFTTLRIIPSEKKEKQSSFSMPGSEQ